MTRAEKTVIENIIAIYPYIYGLQESIEREQERAIGDLISPAKTVVKKLFDLDNRRIDLCNLKVLYEFIKRGVAQPLDWELCNTAYNEAKNAVELAGYTLDRAAREFSYLFDKLKRKKKCVGDMCNMPTVSNICSIRNA